MEKLELKHIQPYPIGGDNALRVKFVDSNYKKHHNQNITDTGIIVGLNIWNITNSTLLSIESSSNGLRHSCTLDEIKPILRPMSDLNKPLEDGSIPIVELAKIAFPKKKFDLRQSGCWCRSEKFMYDKATNSFRTLNEDGGCFSQGSEVINQLELFSYLFTHNFDVFGLIDKGLAIDINTVKQ